MAQCRSLVVGLLFVICLADFALASQSGSPASAQSAGPTVQEPHVTAYVLAPDRYQKARSVNQIHLWGILLNFFWGVAALWLVLHWKLSATYRNWAENTSTKRFVQAVVFTTPLILTIDILGLPVTAFRNWVLLKYGLSVQGWGSWFWDWSKGELLSVIFGAILVWILYAIIRTARQRWWLYFWLVSLPIGLFVFFLQPLIIDPLFFKFEPLAQKEPALTASLERMVQHAGEYIPSDRMFWMGASEKLTVLNAYVTGFGASKRLVVWDTTIAKMTTPQIVMVAGHEMGHYVLGHIPKFLGLGAALLFVLFYLGYRTFDWLQSRCGERWGVRGVEDFASLPALLLLLSVFYFCATPAANALSRNFEQQADQYGLEVTHNLTPNAAQVCAQTFDILGDVNLDDPEPNPVGIFLYYDHPPTPDRVHFCLAYDPWSIGQHGEFVP
jgi:Zn-dependent protease with chaperone function